MRDFLEMLWSQGYTTQASIMEELSKEYKDELTDYEIELFSRRFVRDKNLGLGATGKAYGQIGRY